MKNNPYLDITPRRRAKIDAYLRMMEKRAPVYWPEDSSLDKTQPGTLTPSDTINRRR